MNEIKQNGNEARRIAGRKLPARQKRALITALGLAVNAEAIIRANRITSHPDNRLAVAKNAPRIAGLEV